jgi:hypothetical protein
MNFAQVGLEVQSSYLYLHCTWNYRWEPPHQACSLRQGLVNFFAWACLKPQSSYVCLPSNCNYRWELLCLTQDSILGSNSELEPDLQTLYMRLYPTVHHSRRQVNLDNPLSNYRHVYLKPVKLCLRTLLYRLSNEGWLFLFSISLGNWLLPMAEKIRRKKGFWRWQLLISVLALYQMLLSEFAMFSIAKIIGNVKMK